MQVQSMVWKDPSHLGGKWQLTLVFFPENSQGQRSLAIYSSRIEKHLTQLSDYAYMIYIYVCVCKSTWLNVLHKGSVPLLISFLDIVSTDVGAVLKSAYSYSVTVNFPFRVC